MKKECANTRKSLRKYLQGHLFKLEQIRIERHLKSCAVCSSEYQALKHADETRQFLKDITPPAGVVQRMKEGVTGLAKLKKLIYRPLWIGIIIGVLTLVYVNVMAPRHRDIEIENLEKSLPPEALVASKPTITPAAQPVVVPSSEAPTAALKTAAMPAVEPLAITITLANEKGAIRHINEIIMGHGTLGKIKFSDSVREISGSLSAQELRAVLDSIGSAGKAAYSRKRIESFPAEGQIRFVIKLKPAPGSPERSPSQTPHEPSSAPVGRDASSAPTPTTSP